MDVSYGLRSTTISATKEELSRHRKRIAAATKAEESRGRKVNLLVKLEIHEAGEKQVEEAPAAQLFPRPVCNIGAMVPVILADKLREYAALREQPLSDVSRVLWVEFLIAKKRGEHQDEWVRHIERQLDEILALRQSNKKISYARTRSVSVRRDRRSSRSR